MSDTDRLCHNCKWFSAEADRGPGGIYARTTCHRFPPQVITLQIGGTHTAWPSVHATDWCGEWARAQFSKKS
jgi:hypothetical protein